MTLKQKRDAAPAIGFSPLYQQVKSVLLQRLVDGVWVPGSLLPSEIQLAAEIGVSQGTVRKALDELAAENLLVRRQGRGTFVAEHDERRILFQFFKLVPDHGERRFPESAVLNVTVAPADAEESAALAIEPAAGVIRIRRLRALDGRPLILETLSLPQKVFAGLDRAEIPNNLYSLFASRYGITIARARERLKAVALSADDAAALSVATGTPALRIDRIALALDGMPVERRLSLCLTEEAHYLSDLR
ncbi:GntR family transcriptional regulator [Bosea thiooxidans]|uniref:GntR family transcriptional regulator n=1 Tax=Bosea thiooxidans TaxID=53254 RepID=A0A0Q3KUL2_9HYPH|nr:GntR family transcriptional regulator [Bosea thiooxidans]KQK28140.1 GntR family transcriptional regulator [Bosea thiooxidans]SKB50042.1 GntR family transcriptional regulator [Bosea thiooxidans]